MHQRELVPVSTENLKINLNESLDDVINILDYVIVYYIQILCDFQYCNYFYAL